MPSTIKDHEVFEQRRKDRVNRDGQRTRGRKRNKASRYDDWTVYELKMRVKELGMLGYSDKSRAELIDMLPTTEAGP